MSERGVFAVDRGIFDHPMFAPEPYTEREAWLWMLSAAAWGDKRVRVGKAMVDLKRGQLAFATRFLATRWQWSHSKVVRFLKRLEIDTMIGTSPTREATLITVCNYSTYQFGRNADETQTETHIDTPAERERNKEEETNNLKTEDVGGKRAKLISDEARDTADALAAACGFPDPRNCPLGWYGAAAWVQKCFNEGWPADLMIEAARETAKRKRDGPIEHFKYLEKPLAKAIAEHSRPLPVVEIRAAETVVAYGTGTQKTESLSTVARRHAADGIAFGERPPAPGLRLLASSPDVRLLPQSGGERSGDLCSSNGGDPQRISSGSD